jgi:DNA invertase Pin-like site-specific DNA recombinase
MSKNYVAYYRVSTVRQGRSGLGLDAQAESVRNYICTNSGTLVAEFVEVESGRRKDRQELTKAIHHARVTRSTLVIAKLDRLARNVSFTAALMEAGLDFVAVDLPQANKFTIYVMAALAEMEAEMISARTKAALAEARKRGVRLGNPRLAECRGNQTAAVEALKAKADSKARSYMGLVLEAKQAGQDTLQGVADFLNGRGALTPAGCLWRPTSVSRLLVRLGQ